MNYVFLVGNLGNDAELKHTQSGQCVCSFSLATSVSWKDVNGEWQSKTTWHYIKLWGAAAGRNVDYLKKGEKVVVFGSIDNNVVGEGEERRVYSSVVAKKIMLPDLKKKTSQATEVSGGHPEIVKEKSALNQAFDQNHQPMPDPAFTADNIPF